MSSSVKKHFDLTQLVLELKKTDTRLAMMEKNYSERCSTLTNNCKSGLKTKPKFQLLGFLRRKKMLMSRRTKISQQREELFKKVLQIEQMQVTNDHVETLKKTLSACRELVTDLNVDDVEKVVDDLQEMNQTMNEVCDAMTEGSPLLGGEIDMDELENELAQLSHEIDHDAIPILPIAPTSPVYQASPQKTNEILVHKRELNRV